MEFFLLFWFTIGNFFCISCFYLIAICAKSAGIYNVTLRKENIEPLDEFATKPAGFLVATNCELEWKTNGCKPSSISFLTNNEASNALLKRTD